MAKFLAILFGVIFGVCAIIIQLKRERTPWFTIKISELVRPLDSQDKKLAIIGVVSFVLCIIFAVLSFEG